MTRAESAQERFSAAVKRTAGRNVDLADYTRHPITRQWACRWCCKALKNNRAECPCWKGLSK